ncbi:MAG: pyrroloquinoline quinone precursor peptide PqqA [Candidatus Marinimicrobia bacterium]|nr:pyrroloquinoline quinone precursor peptide PqqA [Candidatus Neomarinimicrobiota bacterium]
MLPKISLKLHRRKTMWTKPTYENIRLGFEITMYAKSN